MSYLVLARKWRPQRFDEVVGQQHVTRTLANAIRQDRVAHAFLFTGSRGVGKTSTARILAKAMNCVNGPTPEPCNECIACTEITNGRAVDVIEIDGASNRGINEIREVREAVRYAPSRDRYKVYIIDEVHMLTTEAFNALLKTLEEPPAHAIFVFATTEPNKIPVTILSRTQRYDFKRVQVRDIVKRLSDIASAEGLEYEDAALALIARHARGGVRDSLSAMDQVIAFTDGHITAEKTAEILGVAGREHLLKLGHSLVSRDVDQALTILDFIDGYGHDLVHFAVELLHHLRDMTVVRSVADAREITDLSDGEYKLVAEHVSNTTVGQLQRLFQLMAEAVEQITRSQFPKLLLEMTLVKLAAVEPLVPLEPLLARMESLEKTLQSDDAIDPETWERYRKLLKETAPEPREVKVVVERVAQVGSHQRQSGSATPAPAAPEEESSEPAPAPQIAAAAHSVPDSAPDPAPDSSPTAPSEPKIVRDEPSLQEPSLQEPSPQEPSPQEPSPQESSPEEASSDDGGGSQTSHGTEVHDATDPGAVGEKPEANPPESVQADEIDGPPSSSWDYGDDEFSEADTGEEDSAPALTLVSPPASEEELEEAESAEPTAPLEPVEDLEERWGALVQHLHPTVGSILSHAVLMDWESGRLAMWLPERYQSFLTDEKRLAIEEVASQLSGAQISLVIESGDRPTESGKSIAEQRDDERREELENQRKQIRESPLLVAAMEQFGVTPDQVSIDVQDEEAH